MGDARLWPSNPYAPEVNGNDAVAVIRIVWQWINHPPRVPGESSIHALAHNLETAGYPCPDDLKEN